MRSRNVLRLGGLLALSAATLGIAAPVAAADTNQHGFHARLRLQSSTPNTPTGVVLNLVRPNTPSGKPKTETVGVFTLPKGTRVSLRAVPPCMKDDRTLQAEGPFGCPQSFIGTGFFTLYSGFGPPLDPIDFDQHWYYAPHELVQLITAHRTTMPVLRVLRAKLRGRTVTAELKNLPPGWPPGTTSAPKETDLTIARFVGRHGAFVTTPRRCPRSGHWTSKVTLHYADHTTDTLRDRTPCRRPRHRHHRDHRHRKT